MAVIMETRHLGIHCGRVWTILILLLSVLYLLICITATLVTRIYLKGFYSAAHVAVISAIVSLFIIFHHLGRLRKTLGISKKAYSIYQGVLNSYFLLCCLATSIGYSVLASDSINTNYDYLGALWFGWMSTVLLAYLVGVVISSFCTHRSESYDLPQDMNTLSRIHFREDGGGLDNEAFDESESPMNTFRKRSRTKYADDPDFNVDDPERPTYLPPPREFLDSEKPSRSRRCCKITCRTFFGILYVALQLVLIVLFFMTAYHPFCVLSDVIEYRNDNELYTVEIDNYRSQALFMRCYGNGADTIVFENDIRTTAYMTFEGLPKYMADQHGYRICVYDRRGKGWSEGLENDFVDAQKDEPQWSESNVRFLKELVTVAKIKTPFYYAGFGYGGHHVTYMALDNSRMVKGLIYINPAMFGRSNNQASQNNKTRHNDERFEDLKSETYFAEIFANLLPTGFIRLSEQLGIKTLEDWLEDYADFSTLSTEVKDSLFSSLRSGTYFSAQVRENDEYLSSDYARKHINRDVYKKKIGKNVIIVQGSNSGIETVQNWFPKEQFLRFSDGDILTVNGGTFNSMLMPGERHMMITAEFIKDKLQAL